MSNGWTPILAPGAIRIPEPPRFFQHAMERHTGMTPESWAWLARVMPSPYDGWKPFQPVEILPSP